MSWGAVTDERPASENCLAADTTKATFLSEAAAAGYLAVELAAPKPPARGRLALVIDGAIERALEARGAPPPRATTSGPREPSLDDQTDRARISGAAGLALWVSSLEAIAAGGTLDCDDSATIRWWIHAAGDHPVRIGFDERNGRLGVYMEPRSLESILAEAVAPTQASEPDPVSIDAVDEARERRVAAFTPELDGAPAEDQDQDQDDDAPLSDAREDLAESARAMAEELDEGGDNGWLRDALMDLSTPPPRPTLSVHLGTSQPPLERAELRAHGGTAETRSRDLSPSDGELEQATALGYDDRLPLPPVAPRLDLHFAEPHAAPERARPELDEATRRRLETCARELAAASGPKPLTVVERLFTTAYVPLRAALDRGVVLPHAETAADEWARGFEKSYIEGFDALRMRSKRPPMTVDVPDIALRVGRLHGARSTQLLLVDAMRYDLGDAVNERLHALVGQRAACAERFLLWSALPTTTGTQVELIGRGPAGLKEAPDGVSEDMIVARGRKAAMIRRLKSGHREILKLDVVAARINEPGGHDPDGFESIADEVAQRIAAHFEGLQPRTLVMVFGDHGFALSGRGDGALPVREGGASPEEVLVPAFAWLVGAVH